TTNEGDNITIHTKQVVRSKAKVVKADKKNENQNQNKAVLIKQTEIEYDQVASINSSNKNILIEDDKIFKQEQIIIAEPFVVQKVEGQQKQITVQPVVPPIVECQQQ